MPHAIKIAVFSTIVAALAGLSDEASARGRLYPLNSLRAGSCLSCPIHGYYDQPPFHYNLAVHPGCIKMVRVETPAGVERRRAIVSRSAGKTRWSTGRESAGAGRTFPSGRLPGVVR